MGSNILETEGLSKKYAGVLRVNDLDIRIKEGCYVYCAPFFWRPPTPHVLAALRPP